jgi:hypothetical protein
MWASFLGQNPTVWFPGTLYHPILENPARETSTRGEPPLSFIEECAASLQTSHAAF